MEHVESYDPRATIGRSFDSGVKGERVCGSSFFHFVNQDICRNWNIHVNPVFYKAILLDFQSSPCGLPKSILLSLITCKVLIKVNPFPDQ